MASSGRRQLRRVKRPQALHVPGRQACHFRNVFTRPDLRAIPAEELHDIAAIAKEIHDVAEIARVLEAERVTELVNASQVDDRVSKKDIRSGARGEILAERIDIGTDEHGRAAAPPDDDRLHFAVLTTARLLPEHADAR